MASEGDLLLRRQRRPVAGPSTTPSPESGSSRSRRRVGTPDVAQERPNIPRHQTPMVVEVDPGLPLDAPITFEELMGTYIVNTGLPPCIIPRRKDRFLELPVVMCTCKSRKITQGYSRVTAGLEMAERDFFEQNQRDMSDDERAPILEELLMIERRDYGMIRECCLKAIKDPMIIPPTVHNYDAAKYRQFDEEMNKFESYGNMKVVRVKKELPTNPLAPRPESTIRHDPDDVDYNPMVKIALEFKPGKTLEVGPFPEVPVIGKQELYNEFKDLKIVSAQDDYEFVGTAHTGVPGYETRVIRRRNILAR
ncbi:Hypothetical protein POVR1_LOCUS604 [uncultured virus]|nr:Hypothetical protein POVR1_LOCUS604 [uncultured virus]